MFVCCFFFYPPLCCWQTCFCQVLQALAGPVLEGHMKMWISQRVWKGHASISKAREGGKLIPSATYTCDDRFLARLYLTSLLRGAKRKQRLINSLSCPIDHCPMLKTWPDSLQTSMCQQIIALVVPKALFHATTSESGRNKLYTHRQKGLPRRDSR